jgi:hypothetical protein
MHNIAEGRGSEHEVGIDHPGIQEALATFSEQLVDRIEQSNGSAADTLTPPEVLFPVEFSYQDKMGYACLVRLTNIFGDHLIPTSRGIEVLESPALMRISSLPGEPGAIITHVLHENEGFDESGEHLIQYFSSNDPSPTQSSFLETIIENAALELTGNHYQFQNIEAEFTAIRSLEFEASAPAPVWMQGNDAPEDGIDVFRGAFLRNPGGKFIAKVRFKEAPQRFMPGGSEYGK